MLARKRPDISWSDLAFGMLKLVASGQHPNHNAEFASDWFPSDQALVCLSVRSGLDLFLQAINLPRGSEIVVTSITIPDILRIIEHHGLVPVPVSIDPSRLEPIAAEIEGAVTPRTRAILVAHLFGSRIEMQPIIDISKRIGVMVIEDCAQAFIGCEFSGHEETDAALFSFGPIKTATALGGAVLRVRDANLRGRMLRLQSEYPRQSRLQYFTRTWKYAVLKVASSPILYGLMVRLLHTIDIDRDAFVNQLGRGFAGRSFFSAIRHKPCKALMQLVEHRVNRFDREQRHRLNRRIRIGKCLLRCLTNPAISFPGSANHTHTFWVVAVRGKHRDHLLRALRDAGFDATMRSSLRDALLNADDKNDQNDRRCPWIVDTIFLPTDPAMSAWKLRQMCKILKSASTQLKPDTAA